MAVYNRAVMKESFAPGYSKGPSNAIEFMIEAERIDNKLFESIIEVDFAEAYNEAGIISLTEAEQQAAAGAQKKGFFAKIGEIAKKAIEAVKRLIGRIVGFFEGLIKNDQKLSEKYGKYINKSALAKCPATGKYVDVDAYNKACKYIQALSGQSNDSETDAWTEFDFKDPNTYEKITDSKGKINQITMDKIVVDSGDKPIISTMRDEDFGFVVDCIITQKVKERITEFRKLESDTITWMTREQKDAEGIINNKESDETAVQGANIAYKNTTAAMSLATYAINKIVAMTENAIKVSRANYLKFAHWAAVGAKNESAAEFEAKAMLIEMVNEDHIDKLMGRV